MRRITNGINTFTVTHGAYMNLYKPMGYQLIDGTEDDENDVVIDSVDEAEEREDDEVETPLSEMTLQQLKEKAVELGISIKRLRSKKDLIQAIKNG